MRTSEDPAPPTSRRLFRPGLLVGLAVGGALAGIAARIADASGAPWAADLGSSPAVWVLAVGLLGRFAPTWASAALRSAVFFAAQAVAYYAWAQALGSAGSAPAGILLASLLLVPAIASAAAAAMWWAGRHPALLSGLVFGAAAALVLVGGQASRQAAIWSGAQPYLLARPVQAGIDVLVALLIVVGLPRHGRTRLWALASVVPLAWLLYLSNLVWHVP